jgi:hypothetical protein
MAGLLLGFILRVTCQRTAIPTADEILLEGVFSAGRSLIWFGSFALLDSIAWPGRVRLWTLTAGIGALLLNLLISGGIMQPSVALPMWIMAALAVNEVRLPEAGWKNPVPGWVGAGCAAILLSIFFVTAFSPVMSSAQEEGEAHRYYGDEPSLPGWRNDIQPRWLRAAPVDRPKAAKLAHEYLTKHIIKPLERAVAADPKDSGPRLELALWYQEEVRIFGDPEIGSLALKQLQQVHRIDPDNKEAYLLESQLHQLLSEVVKSRTKEHLQEAAAAMRQVLELDPTDAPLHAESVEVFEKAGDTSESLRQAGVALELEDQATTPTRRLTSRQRETLQQKLAAANKR